MPTHEPNPELNSDDKQFEGYLRSFRPHDAKPLGMTASGRVFRRWSVLAAWATVAAGILTTAALTLNSHLELTRTVDNTRRLAGETRVANTLPRTLGSANALLAQAPSVNVALDQLSFHSQSIELPKDKESAIAVLSKDTDQP